MSEWTILYIILGIGFLLTWVICSKPPKEEDYLPKPSFKPLQGTYEAMENDSLRRDNDSLRYQLARVKERHYECYNYHCHHDHLRTIDKAEIEKLMKAHKPLTEFEVEGILKVKL